MWDKLKEFIQRYSEVARDARSGGLHSSLNDIDRLNATDEEKAARKTQLAATYLGANLAGISLGTSVNTLGLIPGLTTEAAATAGGYGGYKVGEIADEKLGTKWIAPTLSIVGGLGGGVAGYKTLKPSYNYLAKNGVIGYKDIPEEMLQIPVTTQNPLLNVGWAPKQTINIKRAGDLDVMYYPERWDVTNEGANPFGVWLQGKFGTPRTDVTNPGKGTKASAARKIFADRKQYAGEVMLEKPIQTVGEIPNRSDLSYAAERMGSDGIIYNNVYDNGYNNNQVIFSFKRPDIDRGYKFYERPSKLSDAEKLGIPKGERNQPLNIRSENQDYVNKYIKTSVEPKKHTFDIPEDAYFGDQEKISLFNKNLSDFIKTLPDPDTKFLVDKNIVDAYRNYLNHLDLDASKISDLDLQKFLSYQYKTLSNSATGKLKNQLMVHSSPDWFDQFDLSYTGKNTENTGVLGPGNYFSKEGTVYGHQFDKGSYASYYYMNNTQPYIITDISSTPSGYDMQNKGLLPKIIQKYRTRYKSNNKVIFSNPDPEFELKLQQLIDNTPVNDNKAYVIPSTSDGRPSLYKVTQDGGEIMIRRNTGIKSLYPHPSRFIRNEDGIVQLIPTNWSDPRVNFKQGGKIKGD